ncbi:MAG: SRPBCC family protein [Verrucomicrobiota bacterium]
MILHRFQQTQTLPISLKEAWEFFVYPQNLDDITPAEMGFETVGGGDERIFPGAIIEHRVKVAPLVKVTWVTEITQVVEQDYFIDEQRFGPYKFWHHRHRFEACSEGVNIHDHVHYALPLSPLGDIGHFLIRKKLDEIFGFRTKVLDQHFR